MKKNYQDRRRSEQIIYGVHSVTEALQAGKEFEKVILQRNVHGEWLPRIRKMLTEREIPFQFLPPEAMNRLVKGNHQGVAAFLSPIRYQAIEDLLPSIYEAGKVPLVVVLDRITDVRNLGAVARTAECCGAHAIIVPARGSAQINSTAVKTSSGALMTLPVVRSFNLKHTLSYLKESGLKLVAATEKSGQPLWKINFIDPIAILMGSEETGVSPEYLNMCDELAMIPMQGQLASLNVSVATGMFLYEITRQRRK